MKEIIYNYDNLTDNDINNKIERTKALIVNSNNELLFGYADKTYQFVGGHVEPGETYEDCLSREIKEESGIELTFDKLKPFLVIKYYSKDYPKEGINTMTINNYFIVKTDLKPNIANRHLTDYETEWGYELKYLDKYIALKELEKGLLTAKKKNPVLDTMEAVREYLNISSDESKREEWQ